MPEILQDYVGSLSESLNVIEQAITLSDFAVVAQQAHKLKSSSRFIGADALAEAFVQLEQESKRCLQQNVHSESLTASFNQLTWLVAAVLDAINTQPKG